MLFPFPCSGRASCFTNCLFFETADQNLWLCSATVARGHFLFYLFFLLICIIKLWALPLYKNVTAWRASEICGTQFHSTAPGITCDFQRNRVLVALTPVSEHKGQSSQFKKYLSTSIRICLCVSDRAHLKWHLTAANSKHWTSEMAQFDRCQWLSCVVLQHSRLMKVTLVSDKINWLSKTFRILKLELLQMAEEWTPLYTISWGCNHPKTRTLLSRAKFHPYPHSNQFCHNIIWQHIQVMA